MWHITLDTNNATQQEVLQLEEVGKVSKQVGYHCNPSEADESMVEYHCDTSELFQE
jgi:hypothetical protein